MSYVKLHQSILDSSIWLESSDTRIVWMTLMAMANQDGIVRAKAPGITARARVSRAACDAALAILRSPDPYSGTPDHEGRRIVDTPDGILLVNYEAWRDKLDKADRDAKTAARQARWRDRQAKKRNAEASPSNAPVTHGNARNALSHKVTHSDAEAVSEAEADSDQAQRRSDARASGETWATVLAKLRAIHGNDVYDPSTHRESLEWIAARPAGEVTKALANYAADPWARANPGRAHPKHIRGGWDKYLDGPMKRVGGKSGPGAATPLAEFKAEPMGAFDG
jgi:hypothetical protein